MTTLSLPFQQSSSTVWPKMAPTDEIAEIYQSHADSVYRSAYRVTGNSQDAEDVLQTVFLRMLKKETRLDPNSNPGAFLKQAAVRAGIDVIRRRQRWQSEEIDHVASSLASRTQPDVKEHLRRAIAKLEPEQAEMFTLKYIEGLENQEIAALYGRPSSTVGVQLLRIRQRLQEEMSK
jgi:RNA polymerase sigma-70 factor, ECF subfamily